MRNERLPDSMSQSTYEEDLKRRNEYFIEDDEYQDRLEIFNKNIPDKDLERTKDAEQEAVGIVAWIGNQYEVFTNSADYIACVKEEIDYRSTSGFRFNTLTNDPDTCIAVDDIVYNLMGEHNPNDIDYYKSRVCASSEERIRNSELMNEVKELSERSDEFCEEDELE